MKRLDVDDVERVIFSYMGNVLRHDKTLGEQILANHASNPNSVISLQAKLIKRVPDGPAAASDQSSAASGMVCSTLGSLTLAGGATAGDEFGVQAAAPATSNFASQRAVSATPQDDQGLGGGSTLSSLVVAENAFAASTSLAEGPFAAAHSGPFAATPSLLPSEAPRMQSSASFASPVPPPPPPPAVCPPSLLTLQDAMRFELNPNPEP